MKKFIKEVLYRIGRAHGYLHNVELRIRQWRWELMNGFPSKETLKANPELQRSLAEDVLDGVCGRLMEAEIIVANVLSKLHATIEPNKEYMNGVIAPVGSALFNPHHPDFNSDDVKFVVSPDEPLRDRIIKLTKLVDRYNDWRPGTLHCKLQYFANRPAYAELISYFEQIGLPNDIHWLK